VTHRRLATALATTVTLLAGLAGSGSTAVAGSAEPAALPLPGSSGAGDPYFPLDGNGGYDVAHYDVRATMRLASGRLSGSTTIRATATSALSRFNLDLLLTADSVSVNGHRAHFTRPNRHELQVTPPGPLDAGEKFTVRVVHHGQPARIAFGGDRSWFGNAREVVAMNEPHIAAWWFAANDHPSDKAGFDIRVRVPRGRQAIANGQLISRRTGSDWSTWHWRAREPMATYLAFFAAGRFRLERGRTASGLPFTFAVSRELSARQQTRSLALLRRTPKIVAWLETWLGPYPFGSTGGLTTSFDTHFALENQTRPTYPYVGGVASDWIVAHELAHQWVGDSVSVQNWRDIWLNEGLATFLEMRWTHYDGWGSGPEWLAGTWGTYPAASDFWDLRIGAPGPHRLFDEEVYIRGAMTVEALRARIGHAGLVELLRRWVEEKRSGNGSIAEFVALAEDVSGQDLGAFFQAWLYTSSRPAKTAENGLL
jgi:aminopeptidase N